MTGKPSDRKRRTADAPKRVALRDERFRARGVLWNESTLRRVKACGLNHAVSQHNAKTGQQEKREPYIGVKRTRMPDGSIRAGFSGLQLCGSTWACPVCSEKIQAHRQSEIEQALEAAARLGFVVAMITFTVRHSRKQPLKGVWGAVSTGWRAATSGSREDWRIDQEKYGIRGYLRLVETTQGSNGWHVHVHALVFLDQSQAAAVNNHGHLSVEEATALGQRMFGRWNLAVKKVDKAFGASKRNGVDVRLVTSAEHLGAYFAKNIYSVKSRESAAFDMTGSHAKQAKRGNVTPFGILARLVKDGDEADLKLWQEWEQVSRGKRQTRWSEGRRCADHKHEDDSAGKRLLPRLDCAGTLKKDARGHYVLTFCKPGIRQILGLDVDEVTSEKSDEDIVEDDALDGDVIVQVEARPFRRACKADPSFPARLLTAAEVDDDGHALAELLRDHGMPWRLPPPEAGSGTKAA